MLVALITLLASIGTAVAQTQEKKLVDRLLRPDTSLTNTAQEKKFIPTGGGSFDKRVAARSFHSPEKKLTKPFPGERALTPQQLALRRSRMGDTRANLSTRTNVRQKETINPASAPGLRSAPEGSATVEVHDFAGHRPFLGQGKSQRSLQAYDRPLTIEQVRELLNKSK